MKKVILSTLVVFIILVSVKSVNAMTVPKIERDINPVLVVDGTIGCDLPRNFRTSGMLNDYLFNTVNAPNLSGLVSLRASGSGEFSEKQFHGLLNVLGKPLYIVDLRMEPHAFLDGLPITWTAPNDWVNVGMSHSEALIYEKEKIKELKSAKEVSLLKAESYKSGNNNDYENITVNILESEEDLLKKSAIQYLRLTVIDHLRPSDEEVDRFIEFVRLLPNGAWLHFHCRAGHGRTTTFLVMYDMLKNAGDVSLSDIVLRQAGIVPQYNVLLEDITSEKYIYVHERAEFIKRFYRFAQDYKAGYKGSWSEWYHSHAVLRP